MSKCLFKALAFVLLSAFACTNVLGAEKDGSKNNKRIELKVNNKVLPLERKLKNDTLWENVLNALPVEADIDCSNLDYISIEAPIPLLDSMAKEETLGKGDLIYFPTTKKFLYFHNVSTYFLHCVLVARCPYTRAEFINDYGVNHFLLRERKQ